MVRYVITAILAGLLMFLWSAVSWMALPLHNAAFSTFPTSSTDADLPRDQSSIAQLDLPHTGAYHYPGFPHHEDGTPPTKVERDAAMQRMKDGPVISLMIYHETGRDPFPPMNFILGMAACIVAAGIATWMTWLAAPRLPKFGQRVLFVTALGVFVFFAFYAQSWVWWGYPMTFAIADTIDIVVAPLLAGLVIAGMVKPQPTVVADR